MTLPKNTKKSDLSKLLPERGVFIALEAFLLKRFGYHLKKKRFTK